MLAPIDTPGCIIATHDNDGRPRRCGNTPSRAALLGGDRYPYNVHRVYLCDQHADQLEPSRPITDRDRAELAWRREQLRLALAGKPFRRIEPIATGLDGKQLVARARAWAERRSDVDRS